MTCENCRFYHKPTGLDEFGEIQWNDDYDYCEVGGIEEYLFEDFEIFHCHQFIKNSNYSTSQL